MFIENIKLEISKITMEKDDILILRLEEFSYEILIEIKKALDFFPFKNRVLIIEKHIRVEKFKRNKLKEELLKALKGEKNHD